MVTRNQRNVFIVEGVKAGTTYCRVGTDPNLPSYMFEVVIRDGLVAITRSSASPDRG
jgi:hypothetical protein